MCNYSFLKKCEKNSGKQEQSKRGPRVRFVSHGGESERRDLEGAGGLERVKTYLSIPPTAQVLQATALFILIDRSR